MPLPAKTTFVTFDVYGTLIDWETGIWDAFAAEATRDGFTIEREEVIPLFHEISRQIEGGSYELYAEVLRRTAVEISKRLGWPLEPSRSGFLPDSVQHWQLFREARPQLEKLSKKYRLGLISNIDDKLLGQTRRHIPIDFDLVVTAQQVRSYKPDARPLQRVRAADRRQEGLGSRGVELLPRRRALREGEDPGDLGQPPQGDARRRPAQADGRGPEPARGGQAARRRLSRRARRARDRRPRGRDRRREPGLAHDGDGGAQRRRGVPDRLAGVPRRARAAAVAARAGAASPSAACSRRTATGTTCSAGSPSRARARRRRDDGGAAARAARARPSARCATSTSATTSTRPAPLALGSRRGAAGARLLRPRRRASSSCTRPTGTPSTAWRSGSRWARVLVCGDYLSPVEIPTPEAVDRRLPRDARAARAADRAGRPRRRPATAAPIDRRERAAAAGRGPRLPRGAARGERAAARAARRPPRRRAAAAARRQRGAPQGSRRPMNMSRPAQRAVRLAAAREAERLVERDRAGVVLVGVELDPLRAARVGALERELDERAPDAAPARARPRRRGPRASSRASRSRPSGGSAAGRRRTAARRRRRAPSRNSVAASASSSATEAATDSALGCVVLEPVAEGEQQPRDVVAPRRGRASQTSLTSTRSPRARRRRRPRRRPRSAAPRPCRPCAR